MTDSTVEMLATRSELITARWMSSLLRTSAYHSRLNPFHTVTTRLLLKE